MVIIKHYTLIHAFFARIFTCTIPLSITVHMPNVLFNGQQFHLLRFYLNDGVFFFPKFNIVAEISNFHLFILYCRHFLCASLTYLVTFRSF